MLRPDNSYVTDGLGSGLCARLRVLLRRRLATETERGATLIEILIGIVLLGSISVAMMGTLMTVTKVSNQQQSMSVSEAEGRRLVERLRAVTYQVCAGVDRPNPVVPPLPAPPSPPIDGTYDDAFSGNDPDLLNRDTANYVTAQIIEIKHWDGTLEPNGQPHYAPFTEDCASSVDCGLQKITLRVTAQDSKTDYTFVKRSETLTGGVGSGC